MKSIILSLGVCSLLLTNIYASSDEFEDEFADEELSIQTVKQEKQKSFSNYGSVTFLSSYNYAHDKPTNNNQNDFRGLSSSKLSLDLTSEYKFENGYKAKANFKVFNDFIYDIKSSDYNTTPKDYDIDFDINELYLQGSLNQNIDFKVGRQIVVWGKSDNIRITDILNPMDYTTPGMVDIKDLRLGSAMAKIDYFKGEWSYNAIILAENRFSKLSQYGSDFAPANESIAKKRSVNEPDVKFKNHGIALSASGNFSGQDVAFYAANKYVDNSTYKTNMLGFAYNKVMDSFLFKTELAHFDNYDSDNVKAKTDVLLGLEYNGISDGSVSFEVANKDKQIQYAVRFTQSYINQTLDFTALYNGFAKDLSDGGFIRVWLDYDVDDKIQTSVGIIDYLGGNEARFDMIENNDRIFASVEYSF